ncbi:MAG: flippase-like domain-containing protein [Nitrospirae bacterium]|nr:flippase-like domain-containing protein [Nitrospirota bacterium]
MKENAARAAGVLLLLFFLWWFAGYFLKHREDFRILFELDSGHILLLALLNSAFLFINGISLKVLVRASGVAIGSFESFGISVLSSLGNYITPYSGGAGFRAIYLKKRHGLSYADFAAGFAGSYIINYLIVSAAGIFCLVRIYYNYGIFSPLLAFFFAGLFLFLASVMIFTPSFKNTAWFLSGPFGRALCGWDAVRKNRPVLFKLAAISLINMAVSTAILLTAFNAAGVKAEPAKALLMNLLYSLSLLISITPGSVGIAEAVLIFSGRAVGISTAESLIASIMIRAVQASLLFLTAPLFSLYLRRRNGFGTL